MTGLPADPPQRLGSKASIGDFAALRLDNGIIRAEVLPDLGGRIWNLWDLPSGRQWIWHNDKVPLGKAEPGAAYDDAWAGGWEELFPNDAPGEFLGRVLPDHGEWWSRPWSWEFEENSADRCVLRLELAGRAARTRCEKRVVLESVRPRLTLRYRIQNLEDSPLFFLFKGHLPVSAKPDDVLELPGGSATRVDPEFSTRARGAAPFAWPWAKDGDGRPVDLSRLPPRDQLHREFLYLESLPEGWCGLRDASTGHFLRLSYPLQVFPFTWLFMDFGGWRGHYTVVLEPCTNMPKDLAAARKAGRCARLGPGEVLECQVELECGGPAGAQAPKRGGPS